MFYLGIDISKDKFDVTFLDGKKGKHKVFKNNEDCFERLVEWLKQNNINGCLCKGSLSFK